MAVRGAAGCCASKSLVDDVGRRSVQERYCSDRDDYERGIPGCADVARQKQGPTLELNGEQARADRFPEREDDRRSNEDQEPDESHLEWVKGARQGAELFPVRPKPKQGECEPGEGEAARRDVINAIARQFLVLFASRSISPS